MVEPFARDYSAAIVTDDAGVARCSNEPAAAGLELGDREIFRLVRGGEAFVIGSHIASRVTSDVIIPLAMPINDAGQFRGMCALGISLRAFVSHVAPPATDKAIAVVLVDSSGAPVGGDAETTLILPVPARIKSAIAGTRHGLLDYGRDGRLYEFRLASLAGGTVFAVGAVPVEHGVSALLGAWRYLALAIGAVAMVLAVLWFAAGHWAMRPLERIREFAARVALGGEAGPPVETGWSPELIAVRDEISELAKAIASREAALRDGLEQRDHMLREIHHRVKNNLQMISSLLNLQAGEIRSPRIRRYFADAQNRVLTLSILHRHLYERSSWSLVDFQQFISDLVRQLSVGRAGTQRTSPRFHIRAPIMAVGPDTAIPVGLIVTEAVGSALAHDFSRVSVPEIRIETKEREGREVELVIEDNGADRRTPVAPEGGGFGFTLIRGLAMQLGGEALILSKGEYGSRVTVTFPLPAEDEQPHV
ncbi:MAG: hypothetical protein KIT25_14595 [Enhydrobacter sp.]|nr:MAG: hypothetical protein KIT25_14595 [Enhydrobacter sp.]